MAGKQQRLSGAWSGGPPSVGTAEVATGGGTCQRNAASAEPPDPIGALDEYISQLELLQKSMPDDRTKELLAEKKAEVAALRRAKPQNGTALHHKLKRAGGGEWRRKGFLQA